MIVGHSFGASILLKVLAQEQPPPRTAVLLAMPDWGPGGWNVPEYQFEGPEPASTLELHHCRDDDVVPFAHLTRHAERLLSAQVHEHQVGGHQFDGLIETLAASIIRGD